MIPFSNFNTCICMHCLKCFPNPQGIVDNILELDIPDPDVLGGIAKRVAKLAEQLFAVRIANILPSY